MEATFPQSINSQNSALLTPKQAAVFLGVSEKLLRQLRESGEIQFIKLGGNRRLNVRYTEADLTRFVDNHRETACPYSKGPVKKPTRTGSNIVGIDFQAKQAKPKNAAPKL